MTRFARFALPLFVIALLIGLITLSRAEDKTDADDTSHADVMTQGVSLGDHVLGPPLKPEDLSGKVVVFEYWGDRCPPCIKAIPGIVKLRAQYDTSKLAIVANQVWTKQADKTKMAWEKAGGDDSVTVVNHASLKGTHPSGVPHAFVLDHTGKQVWAGHPAQPEMKEAVKKAVAAMPGKA